jgi:hypothetical protein
LGGGNYCAKPPNSRYNQTMSTQNQTISNENLLSAVVSLPKNEFERLITTAKRLRGKSAETLANKEVRLIKKVNEATLTEEEYQRFYELIEKRRDEIISENERTELLELTDKSEELNVKRLKYLLEIANIRNKSLREVMKELEIFPAQTI